MIATENVPHSPAWLDLTSPDLDAACAFYAAVFGWSAVKLPGYAIFAKDGKPVAAAAEHAEDEYAPAWTPSIRVPDADAAAETVRRSGGATLFQPREIGAEGHRARIAWCTDPDGARFGLWQPVAPEGPLGAELFDEPGSLCWIELRSSDTERSKRFYADVFGWTIENLPVDVDGDIRTYEMFVPNPENGPIGGMWPAVSGFPVTADQWTPYFEVEDCDATTAAAVQAGGTVRMGPGDEFPGRLCVLDDPFGATFAVITSTAFVPVTPPPGRSTH